MTHKYLGDRHKTHLNLSISFKNDKLTWVNIGFQHDIYYQFTITLSRYVSDDYYKSVQFGSNYYDLDEKEQIKRMNYFIKRYPNLVELITNDKNIEKKKELIKMQNEIREQLNKL
jgi:hypothetical protein